MLESGDNAGNMEDDSSKGKDHEDGGSMEGEDCKEDHEDGGSMEEVIDCKEDHEDGGSIEDDDHIDKLIRRTMKMVAKTAISTHVLKYLVAT